MARVFIISILLVVITAYNVQASEPRDAEGIIKISMRKSINAVTKMQNQTLQETRPIDKVLAATDNRPLKILSIDGGGIRGIIPLFYLVQLEEKMGKQCYEVFDVLAGTSTGGMIALALSIGVPAKDILDLYVRRGSEIFVKNKGIVGPKYSSSARRKIFQEFFGERKLSDAKVPVLVTAFEIERNRAMRLCSHYPDTLLLQKEYDMLMSDAALATSAAPTYFEPHKVDAKEAGNDIVLNLIDGGVFANNPVVKAMCYAMALYDESFKTGVPHILSLGTGYQDYHISARRARCMSRLGWALKLFPILLNSPSGSSDDDMDLLLGSNYDRITTFLDYADKDLDKAGDNIGNLLKDAREMITEHEESLEKWRKILLQ